MQRFKKDTFENYGEIFRKSIAYLSPSYCFVSYFVCRRWNDEVIRQSKRNPEKRYNFCLRISWDPLWSLVSRKKDNHAYSVLPEKYLTAGLWFLNTASISRDIHWLLWSRNGEIPFSKIRFTLRYYLFSDRALFVLFSLWIVF